LVSDVAADRNQIAQAAAGTADVADGLARRMMAANIDQAAARRLLKNIAADSDRIASQGERAAEQAAMAIDTLYIATTPAENGQARTAINGLFQLLQNPSAYSPQPFALQMKKIEALLP
ncbi:MAG TPA: hypothetical protein VKS01_11860, partial [Bryobacteraceae bacterium]|nr:hypothetical protein [Bryobacteraceae bacterium]